MAACTVVGRRGGRPRPSRDSSRKRERNANPRRHLVREGTRTFDLATPEFMPILAKIFDPQLHVADILPERLPRTARRWRVTDLAKADADILVHASMPAE